MSSDLSKLIVVMLEEQAALIKKQIDRVIFFNEGQVDNSKKQAAVASQKPVNQKKIKQVVDPNRPKRPSSGYQLFMSEQTPIFKEANHSLTQPELMSAVAKKWTSLSNELKSTYIAHAESLKIGYLEKIKLYDLKNSAVIGLQQKNKSLKTTDVSIVNVPESTVHIDSIANDMMVVGIQSFDSEKKKKKKSKNDQHDDESSEKKKKVFFFFSFSKF
jgi:hypothetical protein